MSESSGEDLGLAAVGAFGAGDASAAGAGPSAGGAGSGDASAGAVSTVGSVIFQGLGSFVATRRWFGFVAGLAAALAALDFRVVLCAWRAFA